MATAVKAEAEASAHVILRTPYRDLLGDRYNQLHPHVRAAHEPLTAEGGVDVVHGTHILTPFLIRVMNLPAAGHARPVTLRVTIEASPINACETSMAWMRQIGATRLNTRQFARQGRLVERNGPGHIEFALQVGDDGALLYQSTRCRFVGVPLPDAVSPHVRATVAPTADGWHVDVIVEWRRHAICRYRGTIRPVSHAP